MRWNLTRHRHRAPRPADDGPGAHPPQPRSRLDAVQERQLASVFEPPRWLRDLGRASWLLVGVVALVAGSVWLLSEISVIAVPVLVGLVVATVASPLVTMMQRHRVPRALGSLVVLLGLAALGLVVLVVVLGGIASQADEIADNATAAAATVETWLRDVGVDENAAADAREHLQDEAPAIGSTLLEGVAAGITGLTSLLFGLSFTVLSVYFLLKDGPALRAWVDRHLGVPLPVARTVTGDVVTSLRRYFTGVTIVSVFNGVVVGLGAMLLGVPLPGTIAVVTFVTAYVPYVGAFVAGAFAVVLALGGGDTTTAILMLLIVLLANGALQQVVQPLAFGATLDLNPLLVLVVTIAAGTLFGMVGLILAAPLVSAGIHVVRDVARIRTPAAAPTEAGETPPVPV
ncbi:MAG TPA: AI-2E family transporter [Gaiellaceae bacterium]|nr:AI-2E family transporter [Gaiellaceae bacterium]